AAPCDAAGGAGGARAARGAADRLPADAGGADRCRDGAGGADREPRGGGGDPPRPRARQAALRPIRPLSVAAGAGGSRRLHHQQRPRLAGVGSDDRADAGADGGEPDLGDPARHPARDRGSLLAGEAGRSGGARLQRRGRVGSGLLPRAAADLVRRLPVAAAALHRARGAALERRGPAGDRAAGADPGRRLHRARGADDADGGARRALGRPCADGARQGADGAARRHRACAAQRADPGRHADRVADRLPARRRGGDGDGLLLARRRAAGGGGDPLLRPADGAGDDHRALGGVHPDQPPRRPALCGARPADAHGM
ncbi:MAG: Dipeptide transport system permease protein DppB, partial [uncultured Craurococcus sp.]